MNTAAGAPLPLRIARVSPLEPAPRALDLALDSVPHGLPPESFFVACDAEDFDSPAGRRWTVTSSPFLGSPSNAPSPGRPGWEFGDAVSEDAFRFLAPCSPANVLGMAHNTGASGRALPPQAFHKAATSVVGPDDAIEVPAGARVEPEAELAVVVGRTARGLTPSNALSCVLGYTVGNDVTDRSAQAEDELWISAKSPDTFTPLGPWIATRLPTGEAGVRIDIDGKASDPGRLADLAWGVEEILVYASSFMTLHPGDVILTGFPGGTARILPGNTVACSVEGVGVLTNPVVEAPAVPKFMELH